MCRKLTAGKNLNLLDSCHIDVHRAAIFLGSFWAPPAVGPRNCCKGSEVAMSLAMELRSSMLSGFMTMKVPHMGGCQNIGPLLGHLNTRCRIRLRTHKGTIILTTTHMASL